MDRHKRFWNWWGHERLAAPRRYVPVLEVLEARIQPATVVQFDVSALLNADVVINFAGSAQDATQVSVDYDDPPFGTNSFLTSMAAIFLGGSGATAADGIPDDGFIAANAFHPEVELTVDNDSNGNNARRGSNDGSGGTTVADFASQPIDVAPDYFAGVHLFLTAGHGDASLNVTLTYTDNVNAQTTSILVPDWASGITETSSTYYLVSDLDRAKTDGSSYEFGNFSIFGFRIDADPSRQLKSITMTPTSVGGTIVFFGALGETADLQISGADSVMVGQPYTLQVNYNPNSSETGGTVFWGDGSFDVFSGTSATLHHVYHDAPNGYVIRAVASGADSASNELLVTVTVPEKLIQDSEIIEGGTTETFGIPGVVATVFNAHVFNDIVLTLAVYQTNPVDKESNAVSTVGGVTFFSSPFGSGTELISYDLRASTPLPGDVIVARFAIPAGATAPDLFFFNDITKTYQRVRGSSRFPNAFTRIGNFFQIIFDETSFPTATGLRGTVFTITDAQGLIPSLITLVDAAPPRPPVNNDDVLAGLLDTGGNNAPTGSTVGVVAPSQVNAFSSQSLTSSSESPESAEARRLSRQIMSILDSVYDQMRNIITPQLHFDGDTPIEPTPVEPTPVEPTPAVPAADDTTELPAWMWQEIALVPADVCTLRTPAPVPCTDVVAMPPSPITRIGSWLFNEKMAALIVAAALPFLTWLDPRVSERVPRQRRKRRS